MWLELDHIEHPMLRAYRRSSPKSRKGLARVLPCNFIGLALAAFAVPRSTVSRWLPYGGVSAALMSPSRQTKPWLGQHVRADYGVAQFLSAVRLVPEYSPNDPPCDVA